MVSIANYLSVFVVGVYVTVDSNNLTDKFSKPHDPNEFLNYLITDLKYYKESGFVFKNTQFEIEVGHFVCDAPARAFLLNVKSHSGFYCCTKCNQKGDYYKKRITFPPCDAALRTNDSFKNREQKEHHTKQELLLLESINIGCVTQFPLDYMHVVCLGVTKQMLKKRGEDFSLTNNQISMLSDNNIALYKQFCSEFNRVPRTLDELDRWKATEFRSFLLYSGIVVLKDVLR